MNKAFFLDRDGVINIDSNYVNTMEHFQFIGGVFDACRIIQSHGYKIIVITNQSGIARGLYTKEQFFELNRWMLLKFKEENIDVTDVYFCPHHSVDGLGLYKIDCECRKPKPGMILKAKKQHSIDLTKSILVGDRLSDIGAGKSAGVCTLYLVNSATQADGDYFTCNNLLDAVCHYFNI
jgi:D-glycero-D-manno-heptose 1,7-bisphosphate phosphatase